MTRTIKILIIAALGIFIIFLSYLYFSNNGDSPDENLNVRIPDKAQLNKDIDSILATFGIKKAWIKESASQSNLKNPKSDLWISKNISIPADLPIVELNYEITNYLHGKNFSEKVTEDAKSKNLDMTIYNSGDSLKNELGTIKFIYSDTLKRDKSDICIIIDSTDALTAQQLGGILNSTESFTFVLPLRNDKIDLQSMITESGKDFVLQLQIGNDEDVTADFRENMKESLWKSEVKSFALNFPNTSGIILKDRTERSDFATEVEKEFIKNGITLYKDTLFTNFKSGEDKINSLLESIKAESGKGKRFIFYIVKLNPEEFNELTGKIYLYKKLGYRFYSFSEMAKRINKSGNDSLSLKK